MAATIAVCNNVDPTGFIYQALPLVKAIKDGMKSDKNDHGPVDEYRRTCSVQKHKQKHNDINQIMILNGLHIR